MEKKRILVVDDEKSNLNVLNHILHQEHIVYLAKDGQIGLEIANECMPDLILLDIIMPDMDGYEVLSTLKASAATQNIPVVFITGLGDNGDREKGLTAGAADYISKPFSATIVKETVNNLLQKAK
jgi:CheY-like chemotaxis protein